MSSDAAGTQFGTYRIDRLIGRGAFASVYLAEDVRPQLRRKVALKVLSEAFSSDPVFRERFFLESLAVAGLGHHPFIVPIHDAGEDQGHLYIAMGFVEGGDFQAKIDQEGVLPVEAVASIVSQVADALDVAHRAGLVHRDVKPGNILLSGDGGPAYLADFGLIRDLASSRALTDAQGYLGTPYYSAPEQFEGTTVSPATDIYALGAVAFHALTGGPAFAGSTESVIAGHLFRPVPSVRDQRPGLPQELDAIIAQAMAKKPGDRYRTAGELASAITRTCDSAQPGIWQPAVIPPAPVSTSSEPAPSATSPETVRWASPVTPPVTSGPAQPKGHRLALALAATAAAVIIGIVALLLATRDEPPSATSTPSTETTTRSTETSTPSTETTTPSTETSTPSTDTSVTAVVEDAGSRCAKPTKLTESSGKPTNIEFAAKPATKLIVQDLETGTGAMAEAGSQVTVNYLSVSCASGREFDSSWGRGGRNKDAPLMVTLGAGQLIKGFDQGLVGMRVGGRRRLVIPGSLAYGTAGQPPEIASNDTLVFVVDLLNSDNASPPSSATGSSTPSG